MTNIWQTWKLCSKASSSMDSDSKDLSVGSFKNQWNTWAMLSARDSDIQEENRGNFKGENSHQPDRIEIFPWNGKPLWKVYPMSWLISAPLSTTC